LHAFYESDKLEDIDITGREETPIEIIERAKKFRLNGCGCLRGSKGGPCSREFKEAVLFNLNNCLELTSGELDLIILANIQAFNRNDCIGTKRSRSSRCTYQFQSVSICKEMFIHLYGIGYNRLCRLKGHYERYGIHPRTHGNTKTLPSNTLPQSITENVHHFLTNYIEENAFVLPGRMPGFKWEDVQVLSLSETKTSVWHVYTATCKASGEQAVNHGKFVDLWHQFCSESCCGRTHDRSMLDMSTEHHQLVRAANLPEHEKADCIKGQQEHLDCAQVEREFYRRTCSDAATTFSQTDVETNLNKMHEPCSFSGTMHYSFDYAKQVHFPSNPMQPALIYFKTPRKCGIFGVV